MDQRTEDSALLLDKIRAGLSQKPLPADPNPLGFKRNAMKIFKRLFSSKELKVTLGVIEELDLYFSNNESIGGNGFKVIKNDLIKLTSENEQSIIKFNNNGQHPRISILFAAGDLIRKQLASGKYNIYRGTINPLSEGPSLISIYHEIGNLLVREGRITEDEAKYSREQLELDISGVG